MRQREENKEEIIAAAREWIKSDAGRKFVAEAINKSYERGEKDREAIKVPERDLHAPVTVF